MESDNFIGQSNIIKELRGLVKYDKISVLFRGNSGCGKTYLAKLFAGAKGSWDYNIAPDLNFNNNVITHVVDEVHKVDTQESLFQLIENKGFVFCTTEFTKINDPLLTRCIVYTFEPYKFPELMSIILVNYPDMSLESVKIIASRCRGVPRIALQYCQRFIALVEDDYRTYNREETSLLFNNIGIYNNGFTQLDYDYLEALKRLKTASVNTLSAILIRDTDTITKIVEPFLLRNNLINITSRGREII